MAKQKANDQRRLGWALVHAALVDDTAGLDAVAGTLDVDEARDLVAVLAEVVAGLLAWDAPAERCAEKIRRILRASITEGDE